MGAEKAVMCKAGLTIGCEAEHDDAEYGLHGAQREDEVKGHFECVFGVRRCGVGRLFGA